MRLVLAKILLLLHLSSLIGYNLFNFSHDFLHWIESEWHHHTHTHFHAIEDHHAVFQAFKENNQKEEADLPTETKVFYAFVYITHFQDLFFVASEKIPTNYKNYLKIDYQNIHYSPILPPPKHI